MNADAFRFLYDYHFSENRKIWETNIVPLSQENFLQDVAYSVGSIRNHVVHMMNADLAWFSGLTNDDNPQFFEAAELDNRDDIRAKWDGVEAKMRAYLASISDDMLFTNPIDFEEDKDLLLWQVLLHVVNHGTDHCAQLLRLLNEAGQKTDAQDLVFYLYEQINKTSADNA